MFSGEYDLLGIPTDDGKFPYSWIITNTHVDNDVTIPERVYEMGGQGKLNISCDYLNELINTEKIDSVVNAYLKKQCTN